VRCGLDSLISVKRAHPVSALLSLLTNPDNRSIRESIDLNAYPPLRAST